MAKISRHGGASDKTLPTDAAVAESAPMPAAAADQPEPAFATGGPLSQEAAARLNEVVGDGSGEALPPVPDEVYGSDAVPLEEGGEESSPGSSSSASTEPQPTNSEPSKPARRKPARKTASRSETGRVESGSASSTAGETTDESPAPDGGE